MGLKGLQGAYIAALGGPTRDATGWGGESIETTVEVLVVGEHRFRKSRNSAAAVLGENNVTINHCDRVGLLVVLSAGH